MLKKGSIMPTCVTFGSTAIPKGGNMFKQSSILFLIICTIFTFILSSCGSESQDIAINTTASETTVQSVQSTSEYEVESDIYVEESEFTVPTASPDKVQLLIDNVELPSIIITDNSTSDEILQAGKTAAKFFSEATEMYFGYGIDYNWKLSRNNDDALSIDEMKPYQSSGIYWKSLGLYTDTRESYVPMNGNDSKQFLIDYLRLTEKGYEELCENSPSTYTIKDESFYVSSGDGGQAGWSYSQIIDYAVGENELGEKVVTYNCERVGDAEEWGYDEDLIQPFTFRLAFEDNTWKLDGVSYGEGFFELKWLIS